jgi:hypothetical protein
MSCQLGGLPVHSKDPKYKTLIKTILDRQIDVVAMQEIGLNFNCTGTSDQWKHRIGWNTWLDGHRTKTVDAWNSLDHVKRLDQYGGVAILALGRTSFYASGSGIDPSKLGSQVVLDTVQRQRQSYPACCFILSSMWWKSG